MQSSIGMVCASFRHDCLELRCVAFAWRRLWINSSWILAVGLRMAMCRRALLLYIAAAVRIHRRSFFSQPFNISLFCKGAPVARDFTLGSTSCPGYTRTSAAPTLHQGVHAYQAFQLHVDWCQLTKPYYKQGDNRTKTLFFVAFRLREQLLV